ncbi:piggyBac transposable element-derived protein 3-like protein [Lates japonicus]|uniref:PiggyBac transposable element-derived protein 3-like protein n=1 Tax=Lates japonicus TaxID=270547 RepID=A0AAD3N1E0_LATJO|nr:piggyBac transposable element-derived protein 3-like protein [Lates japonicus]
MLAHFQEKRAALALLPVESEVELVGIDEESDVDMNLDESSDDSVRVRHIYNTRGHSFSSILMNEMVCEDEQMVSFQGKSQLRQYITMKPKHSGYKFFILADQHGIEYKLDVFTRSIQPLPDLHP